MSTEWNQVLQEIRSRLDATTFRNAVSKELAEWSSSRPVSPYDVAWNVDGLSEDEVGLNSILSQRNRLRTSHSKLDEVITREIIEKLPQPAVIVKEDVLESVAEHLVVRDGCPDHHAYSQFVLSVLERLAPPHSGKSPGIRSTPRERIDIWLSSGSISEGTILARLPSGISVIFDDLVLVDQGLDFIHVSVEGVCSARALDHASRQCLEIMRAVAPRVFRQGTGNSNEIDEENGDLDIRDRIVVARLNQCFSMYFGAESRKKTFQGRRIRNAVQLLIEADRQVNHAIGLALSFGAIESLLGEDTQGIGDDIARKAATLLFPNAEFRRPVIAKIKKMYGSRSKCLHGESLSVEAVTRDQVRELAATVLRAVLDWIEFSVRLGNAEAEAPEFFQSLQYAMDTGKQFDGPSDNLGMSLDIDWFKE
jgi:hypothetical protein